MLKCSNESIPSFPEGSHPIDQTTQWQAIFIDRDGVVNEEPGPILFPEQFHPFPRSLHAIYQINRWGRLCIVVSNQAAFAKGQLTEENFTRTGLKLKNALAAMHAHIDDFFYCPHFPYWQEGFVRELCHPCQCRKPGTLLFEQASHKYQLDLKKTVFIGDKTSDFEVAKRLGMFSIGVRTGHGGRDGLYDCAPQYWADDLLDAIDRLKRNHSHANSL